MLPYVGGLRRSVIVRPVTTTGPSVVCTLTGRVWFTCVDTGFRWSFSFTS